MKLRIGTRIVLSLIAFSCAQAARADYLIDPLSSPTLLSSLGDDDINYAVSLPGGSFDFSLFGSPVTSLYVGVNGNLNFDNASHVFQTALNSASTPRIIAPFWTDLKVTTASDKIVTNTDGSTYYAVTWDVHNFGGNLDFEFQAVLFGGSYQIGAHQFQANDIAFAYNQVGSPPPNNTAVVGLRGNTTNQYAYKTGFGTSGSPGLISDSTPLASLLSTPGQFLLFRPNTDGGYDASFATTQAVPEPATLALLGIGLGCVSVLGTRRRRRA